MNQEGAVLKGVANPDGLHSQNTKLVMKDGQNPSYHGSIMHYLFPDSTSNTFFELNQVIRAHVNYFLNLTGKEK
jgi:hypothetical protein